MRQMDIHVPSVIDSHSASESTDSDAVFTALVAEHHADLVRLAYAMVGNPQLANDLAQSAWTTAWRHRERLREPGKVRGWLLSITANEARRALRRRRLRQFLPLGDHERLVAERGGHDDRIDLVDALQRLSVRDREILARRYALGETSDEIGHHVGMSDSGVRVRIGRLLAALRKELVK